MPLEETEPAQKPSQAEGERNTPGGVTSKTEAVPKPSQAEGDRETVEADIKEKERQGEL